MAMELDKPEWLAHCKPRRTLARLAVLAAAMMIAAPAIPAPTVGETDDSGTPVHIPDVALRKALETVFGKAMGEPITRGEMANLPGRHLYAEDVGELTGMEYAVNLRTLDLRYGSITNLTPLANLRLSNLYLYFHDVADPSPLAGMTSLRNLVLWDNPVADLAPLADMTWLSDLSVNHNRNGIGDLSPLAGMTWLRGLGLAGNAIDDLSPLEGMTSLTDLRLHENAIADLSPLTGMTSLRELVLWDNPIADLSPLVDMTSLTTLHLAENAIADLSPLAGMTSLTFLVLRENAIADVSPLAGMTSLQTLSLDDNQIVNLSPLMDMTSLRSLYLAGNTIADMSPLVANGGLDDGDSVDLTRNPLGAASLHTHIPALRQRGVLVSFDGNSSAILDPELRSAVESALGMWGLEFATLKTLHASNRGIEDLTGLGGASGLRFLYLERNQIADISPLSGLTLNVLILSHNRVEDFSPLVGTRIGVLALDGNLLREIPPYTWYFASQIPRYLYLANNNISDIGPLAPALNLWELDVSGNSITSLAPLYSRDSLRYLHVHDNKITDISPLNFTSLRELHMRNNAVRDISPLLDGEELLAVDVRRNPLTDDALGVLETLRERGVTVLAGETVPYFPAAGGGREGFVRIVNRGDEDGHMFIEAVDDAGVRAGPVRLDVGARRAVHFNSGDLENGNATKGIDGVGAPTAGDWRLEVISALDVEVLSYIRTKDGFVTAMHDVAADGIAPFFNPGSNRNQRSILRMVNTEAEPAKWTTGGHDDAGNWRPMAGAMLVRPQHALTLTAEALENAHGLGDGHGKWRLFVRGFPWYAMSLLESPTGHLTNLSTAPDNATRLAEGGTMHRLPLFPAPGGSREGFVRLINRSESYGTVFIKAVGERGNRSARMSVNLSPRQAVHFNSTDLETGNFDKGLVGSVGALGAFLRGDWRLEVTSELALTVLAYARTADGFLTSLHDLAPVAEDGSHRVVFLNPGSNKRQVSKLRLINDGDLAASVNITGIDDQGGASGTVSLTVPAGSAYTFTSAELETGLDDGLFLEGRLGDGEGKWRLRVQSDEPIAVMSLLETPSGHLTNVSTGTAD